MSRDSVDWLQVLNGTVNAEKYIQEVLDPKVLPSARDIFGDGKPFIFQQDGAPCHTAKKCIAWCKKNKVELLDWPCNNPDLNWKSVGATEASSSGKATTQQTSADWGSDPLSAPYHHTNWPTTTPYHHTNGPTTTGGQQWVCSFLMAHRHKKAI